MNQILTEDQIEMIVEKTTNGFDHQLLTGKITQSEYDREISTLNSWTIEQLRILDESYDLTA